MADSVFDTKRGYENVDAAYGRNGHDFIENGFTPVSGRTYYFFVVLEEVTMTYDDASGTEHTAVTIPAGIQADMSGGAPAVTSGRILAFIDKRS